jgi:ribonucleoside-diphosphate reductase alpha chain
MQKQGTSEFKGFNLSIGIKQGFMDAVDADAIWQLFHAAEPDLSEHPHAFQREDGMWVYQEIRARELWDLVMKNTYDFAEPGVLFLDMINAENNLGYCEVIDATNPCGEQPLPDYACCDLGSINLTKFVRNPFTNHASFDFAEFVSLVRIAVRMLDNVLDVTMWPLQEQAKEAHSKRRIGLGFMGLGDALIMLGLPYDSEVGRQQAASIAESMRDAAYDASVDLAIERGSFPLFNADEYLASPRFASRLPEHLKKRIRKHGIRNSHLLSIAPTGTIALTFGDNCSNGIEPAFSWYYQRNKRMPDGSIVSLVVEDHAYRCYKQMRGLFGDDKDIVPCLPPAFRRALDMHALDHMRMLQAVQPFVDSAISKTVNVPADYPFEDFKSLYSDAHKAGLKGITTYRPNPGLSAVLVAPSSSASSLTNDDKTDPDRRIVLRDVKDPVLASLHWVDRPRTPGGNPAWSYMVRCNSDDNAFAVFVGHIPNGVVRPFECWTNGVDQPRGLGAVAKTLSMDMRVDDRKWIEYKLNTLAKTIGTEQYSVEMGDCEIAASSASAILAKSVRYRVVELQGDTIPNDSPAPVFTTLFSEKEPKTGPDGTLSWSVDILNPAMGDDFVLTVKELELPNGSRRPFSFWLSGEYPRELDGLCKLLSIDARVLDPAWIGMKLRKLLKYSEARGDFFAKVPGTNKSEVYPSTVAYLATLLIHRYSMLGILNLDGHPVEHMGVMINDSEVEAKPAPARQSSYRGKECPECKQWTLIRRDGCNFCTACSYIGSCG